MSLSDGLMKTLTDHFTPNQDARSSTSTERIGIETWLKQRLKLLGLFESGSWSHGTAIKASDVDYFAWLPNPRPTSSETALECLRSELNYWYQDRPVTVAINRPTVRLHFNGATSQPDIEVTPAYLSRLDDYFIPDPSRRSGWIKSNPKAHKAYVNSAQKKGGDTKGLVRLIKGWKHLSSVPIQSLYLEMRTSKRVVDVPPAMLLHDMDWLFRDFISSQLAAMNDPSEYDGRRINAVETETQRREALATIRLAQHWTDRALRYERERRKPEMENAIWKVFGVVEG